MFSDGILRSITEQEVVVGSSSLLCDKYGWWLGYVWSVYSYGP